MNYSKLDLFADGLAVPTTANGTTYGRVIDLRRNGEVGIDGALRIYGIVVGAVNATGSVTTVVQTSEDGATWTDLASQTQAGALLIGMFLPFGLKRFVRCKFTVGGTALGSAVKVKCGLVDQFDFDALPPVQTFPPLEDLATDRFSEELVLAETAKTIAKGGNADIAITAGVVTSYTAPSGYTVTPASGKVNIALAANAASGSVVLVDGLGNQKTITVTAGS